MLAASNMDISESITSAMKDLFKVMDRTSTSIPPIFMLNVLHMCCPQFAEKNDHGQFQQQVGSDARLRLKFYICFLLNSLKCL